MLACVTGPWTEVVSAGRSRSRPNMCVLAPSLALELPLLIPDPARPERPGTLKHQLQREHQWQNCGVGKSPRLGRRCLGGFSNDLCLEVRAPLGRPAASLSLSLCA